MTGNGHENETTRLRQLIMGFRTTQLVYVAAKLGLADHLASGPLLPSDLAQIVGANPDALYRLLRALASLGIFAELVDGRFAMKPAGALLRRDRPGTLHSTAVLTATRCSGALTGSCCIQSKLASQHSRTSTASHSTSISTSTLGLPHCSRMR